MGELDFAASTYLAARPRSVNGVIVRTFVLDLLVIFPMTNIVIIVLVISNIVIMAVIVVVSFTARNELSEYLQRVFQATTIIDLYTSFASKINNAGFCQFA